MNRFRNFVVFGLLLAVFVPVKIVSAIKNNSLAMNSFSPSKSTSRSTFSSRMSTVLGGAVSSAQGRIRGKIPSRISLAEDTTVTGTRS